MFWIVVAKMIGRNRKIHGAKASLMNGVFRGCFINFLKVWGVIGEREPFLPYESLILEKNAPKESLGARD